MELPIIEPAPVVTKHAEVFRDVFDNQCQFRHFQHYLTGLIVLPNKSLANMTRCILDSADKTNLSRFLSEAPWREAEVNRRRVRFMLQQTQPHRRRRRDSLIALDDTLCEHVGASLTTWTATITTAMARILWRITRSPASMSVGLYASLWGCACIGAMRN